MKSNSIVRRILAGAALVAMLAFLCGCGKEPSTPDDLPEVMLPSSFSDINSDLERWFASAEADKTAPVYPIMSNAAAVEQRDLNAYMATIDPDSEAYESTREDAEYMFAHYRLLVSINSVDLEEYDDDTILMRVIQTTRPATGDENVPVSGSDVSGSDVSASDAAPLSGKDLTDRFVPCVTELLHTMTLRGNEWYITSTEVVAYSEVVVLQHLPESGSDIISASDQT